MPQNRGIRAACAAAAGAAIYYGASEIGTRKMKLSSLWVISAVALAGMATAKNTSKVYDAHARIDQLSGDVYDAKQSVSGKMDKTGGTFTGAVTFQGMVYCQNDLDMSNNDISRVGNVGPASGNSNVHFTGGATMNGNVDMTGNNVNNCNAVSNGSSQVGHPSGINAAEIGPGGSRANLGNFTVTTIAQASTAINALSDRSDWHNGQMNNANVNY